jgi:CRISPR-associated protein Cas2
MRTRYLVCYDISNPRRLRRVEKTVRTFGTRLQYSVFECPLDDLRFQDLRAKIQAEINAEQDQVLFVSLGPEAANASFRIEAMGLPYRERSRVTIV